MRRCALNGLPIRDLVPRRAPSDGLAPAEEWDHVGNANAAKRRVPAPVPAPRVLEGADRVELDRVLPRHLGEGARRHVLFSDPRALVRGGLQQRVPVACHILSFYPHVLHPRRLVLDQRRVVPCRYHRDSALDALALGVLEVQPRRRVPPSVLHPGDDALADLHSRCRTALQEVLTRLLPAHLAIWARNLDGVVAGDGDARGLVLVLHTRPRQPQLLPLVHPNPVVVGPRPLDGAHDRDAHPLLRHRLRDRTCRRTGANNGGVVKLLCACNFELDPRRADCVLLRPRCLQSNGLCRLPRVRELVEVLNLLWINRSLRASILPKDPILLCLGTLGSLGNVVRVGDLQ
mmetsp:Transcript_19578/g.46507  ORF Transcript_19578/g.46507 Transcript_19578/m.46507 type:complete len:346 (+) Transcript_19578:921-1958(+)